MSFHAKGGLGEVLIAEDTELKRPVALKRILGEAAGDADARRRFVLEAEVTGRLEHPGVVPVYGLGVDPDTGQLSYAMRFITGRSLKSAIDDFHAGGGAFGSLSFRKLLQCFISVCQTMSFAHSKGVLHRDLKPANIMVGAHGETLVVDWGLAKILGEPHTVPEPRTPVQRSAPLTPPRDSVISSSSTVTQTGTSMGTPGYMSPEQAQGSIEQLGPATDVYGLGATLYHVLTGQTPLGDKPPLTRTLLTVQGRVPPARAVRPTVPAGLEAVCRKAMSVLPEQRYAEAAEMAADCERWLADEPVSCLPESVATRAKRWMRRHPTTVATSLAAMVLVGFGAMIVAGLVNAQRSELADKNEQLEDKNRQLADKNAEIAAERDRAVKAEQAAEANFAEARQVLSSCLDLARQHPVFQRPGQQEARELLLRAAAPFHDRFAAVGGTTELRVEAVVAKFEAALQSAKTRSKPEAIALYRKCIVELRELAARFPHEERYRVYLSHTHKNLGSALADQEQLEVAEAELRIAVEMKTALFAANPTSELYRFDLAKSYTSLAHVLSERGQLAPAEEHYRLAVKLNRELAEQDSRNADYALHLAISQNNLGTLLAKKSDFVGSEREYRRGVEITEQLLRHFPGQRDFSESHAKARAGLGLVLQAKRDARAALRELTAARELWRALVKENPAVVQYRADLAIVHEAMGTLSAELGDRPTAERSYRDALALLETLTAEEPQLVEHRERLAHAHIGLAELAKGAGDRPTAIRELRATLTVLRGLTDLRPRADKYRADLGRQSDRLAQLLLDSGDLDGAEHESRERIAHYKIVVERNPKSAEYRELLAYAYSELALVLAQVGRPQRAEPLARLGVEQFGILVRLAPNVKSFQDSLASTRALLAKLVVKTSPAEAIGLLRLAGPEFRSAVVGDSDFDGVRGRPDYRALLAEWDRLAPPGAKP